MGLLDFATNQFSQNGEDGILERIFSLIGAETQTCCEFGAWDGIHFSNTRKLLLDGWSGLFIEADSKKFSSLIANYAGNQKVKALCRMVSETDDLAEILESVGLPRNPDLLSIDIDGLDFYLLQSLTSRPRLICIEVNAGHSPDASTLLPRSLAAANVGQPLSLFSNLADTLGYGLIAYNGNAFLLRHDIKHPELPAISPVQAYREYLSHLGTQEKRWMNLVNKGLVPPFHHYENPNLSAKALGISSTREAFGALVANARRILRRHLR